jgi:hypothetical protein
MNATDPSGMWMYIDEAHWRADAGDTFEELIGFINHYWGTDLTAVNKSCIVPAPEKGGNEAAMKQMWQKRRPAACGVYNVANLVDLADGGELRAAIGNDRNNYIFTAAVFYKATRMTGTQFMLQFAKQSGTGRTPLRSVILIGHGTPNADEIGGDRSGVPYSHVTVTIAGRNDAFAWRPWARAINWDLPMGCWLRTDAHARFVGCETEKMARHAAAQVMRGMSSAYGTTTFTYAVSPQVMGWGKRLSTGVIVQDPTKPTAASEEIYHSHGWWIEVEGEN